MGEIIKQMGIELDNYLDNLIKQTKDEETNNNTPFSIDFIDWELQDSESFY